MQKKILRFDIETVAETSSYGNYQKKQQRAEKCRGEKFPGMTEEESYYQKSWLYPEFARVVCISTYVDGVVKSFWHRWSEEKTIQDFFDYINQLPEWELWGFNSQQFDIPFLWKRCIILGIRPHAKLCVANVKKWERKDVDVMQIRKQGNFGCSLDLLSMALLKTSPKTGEVNAKSVFSTFYWPRPAWEVITEDSRMQKVIAYCEKDVEFTAKCYDKIVSVFQEEETSEEKEINDDIDHLLPKNAREVDTTPPKKWDISERQIEFIKKLWKKCDKYSMVPWFTEKLDEYIKEYYGEENIEGLSKSQASWLVSRLQSIDNDSHPHMLAIKDILMPPTPSTTVTTDSGGTKDDDLPF